MVRALQGPGGNRVQPLPERRVGLDARSDDVSALDELQRLGLLVGRIVEVEEHAGARAPSYVIAVDLGPQGRRQATVPRSDYAPDDLFGAQVACVLDDDELHVLGARSHARGLVLLRPDRDVEEGSLVA